MEKINLVGKQKQLRYVTVYNKLFKLITNGVFPEETRLPSEPELAKSMGISRTTLRQALALLQDDGLINNIRGKGNYIVKSTPVKKTGLEKIGHPIYKCMSIDINNVQLEIHIEPSNEYFKKILQQNTVAVVLADRWYIYNGETVAYSFTVLPIETISKYNIDLNDKDNFLNFLEKEIYSLSKNTLIDIKHTNSGNFATKTHHISADSEFHLLQETLYENSNSIIASNKHYMPVKLSKLQLKLTSL